MRYTDNKKRPSLNFFLYLGLTAIILFELIATRFSLVKNQIRKIISG